jgi:hypothetical protein
VGKIKFDSKIPLVRKFANERPHLGPTVLPLVASSDAEHKEAQENAKKFGIDYLVKTERELKRSSDPNDFHYWTIEDYAAAYRKGLTTPVEVAKRVINAIRQSEAMAVRNWCPELYVGNNI